MACVYCGHVPISSGKALVCQPNSSRRSRRLLSESTRTASEPWWIKWNMQSFSCYQKAPNRTRGCGSPTGDTADRLDLYEDLLSATS
ncbi:hypothetical protein WJX84_004601 [Apatococcus fuscideae]|uniref:Uncharacterized protein n=1 Tax=Apatococcus fuscideae TaxID=2026836 RepID=A0AAW1SL88_9CHLO